MQQFQPGMTKWINAVTSNWTAMDQKVSHEIQEARKALVNLEFTNREKLQQGLKELRNHLKKEIKSHRPQWKSAPGCGIGPKPKIFEGKAALKAYLAQFNIITQVTG